MRYIPIKLLSNICTKLDLKEVMSLLHKEVDTEFMYTFNFSEKRKILKTKHKDITDDDIKQELCYIFRDKILKYFTYKLK